MPNSSAKAAPARNMPMAIPHHRRVVKNLQQLGADCAGERAIHQATSLRLVPSVRERNSSSRSARCGRSSQTGQPGGHRRVADEPQVGGLDDQLRRRHREDAIPPAPAARSASAAGSEVRTNVAGRPAELGHRALPDQARRWR